jgi:regulator of replication initiation timing
MTDMNISPEELINNLSQQLGALMAENTALKMAVGKTQEALSVAEGQLASHATAVAEAQAQKQESVYTDTDIGNKKKKR